tara:strand:- start:1062 stop:1313 length:252 start_codon:yes stop_codon:yes gene_type:complete
MADELIFIDDDAINAVVNEIYRLQGMREIDPNGLFMGARIASIIYTHFHNDEVVAHGECNGYLSRLNGTINHDGDTCPIHEDS